MKKRFSDEQIISILREAEVAYPCYIDWQSGLWMSPEQLIRQLAVQGNSSPQKASRWQRWRLKLSYFMKTFR